MQVDRRIIRAISIMYPLCISINFLIMLCNTGVLYITVIGQEPLEHICDLAVARNLFEEICSAYYFENISPLFYLIFIYQHYLLSLSV